MTRFAIPLSFCVFLVTSFGCARNEAPAVAPRAAEAGATPTLSPDSPVQEARLAGERKVIHRASLVLAADDVVQTADGAVSVAERAGGYVASRNDRHAGTQVTESAITLRVPASAFAAVLDQLKESGRVVEEQVSGQDVTAEFVDTKARLRAQRVLEERLLGLSAAQQGVKDLLEVERELSRVRSEIERLEGHERLLENQTSFATLDVVVRSPEQPRVAGITGIGSRLENAVYDGAQVALTVTLASIQVAIAFLPFLPLPLCGYLLYRMRRRRLLSGVV